MHIFQILSCFPFNSPHQSPTPLPLSAPALEEADFVEADNNSESEEELSSDDDSHKYDDIRNEEEEEEESDDGDDDGLEEEEKEELDTDDDSDFSDDDDDDDNKPSGQSDKKDKKGFLAGGKAASFAKAFAKVIGKPAAGTATAPPSTSKAAAVPILAKSKSLAERQAKDAQLVVKDREAKRARLEMKQRGRVQPKPKGQDPDADATEKELLKTATRGVVKLFNAVAKAQKQMRESQDMTGNRLKAAKASRSSFIDELKNRQSGGKVKDVKGRNGNEEDKDNDENGGKQPGWDVLKDGFAGLGGGSKMKDWDRKVEVDSDGGVGDVDMDSDGE